MTKMRVGLEHLEKLYANRNIDRRECDEALASAFPLMAAELRELRKKDRGIQAGCSRCPYCTAVRKDDELAAHITEHCLANPLHSQLSTIEAATLERAAKVCEAMTKPEYVSSVRRLVDGALCEAALRIRSLASHDTGGGGKP